MNVKSYLRKQGYRPELSDGLLNKYEDSLFKYLKEEKYDEFFELRGVGNSEEVIFHFIGIDKKLLKIVTD